MCRSTQCTTAAAECVINSSDSTLTQLLLEHMDALGVAATTKAQNDENLRQRRNSAYPLTTSLYFCNACSQDGSRTARKEDSPFETRSAKASCKLSLINEKIKGKTKESR
jgi:hypothetical protein